MPTAYEPSPAQPQSGVHGNSQAQMCGSRLANHTLMVDHTLNLYLFNVDRMDKTLTNTYI